MNLSRLRGPVLAALAALLVGGAGVALAVTRTPATGLTPVADQTAAPQPTAAEPAGPDADTIRAGDQTGPDIAGAPETTDSPEAAGSAGEPADASPEPTDATEQTETADPAGPNDASGSNTDTVEQGDQSAPDAAGGHADPPGQDVDNQSDTND